MGIREELLSAGKTKTTTKLLREFLLKDCNIDGQFEIESSGSVKRFAVEKKSLGAGVYTVWLKGWNPYYTADFESVVNKFEECKKKGFISQELYLIMIFRRVITPKRSVREYDSSTYDLLHKVVFTEDFGNIYQTNYKIHELTPEYLKGMK